MRVSFWSFLLIFLAAIKTSERMNAATMRTRDAHEKTMFWNRTPARKLSTKITIVPRHTKAIGKETLSFLTSLEKSSQIKGINISISIETLREKSASSASDPAVKHDIMIDNPM